MTPRLSLLVTALALLAGCAAPEAPAAGASREAAPGAPSPPAPLGLAATSCVEGGGHSVHPRSLWEQGVVSVVPEPWVPADVTEDVGDQVVYSEIPDPRRPVPEKGNTMGNYHATMWCEGWTLDGQAREPLFFGFVGMRVEPPEFDDPARPATHHYVVTVVATDDETVLERLRAAGIAAMAGGATREAMPDGTLRIQMRTEGNGDYDSLFKPQPHGDMHAARVRLWWQASDHGHPGHGEGAHAEGAFRPIALDLVADGGAHHVAAGQGWFSHSGTEHHAPLPGAYGHTAAVMFTGFDRTFEWGPRPDVTLGTAYVH